MSVVGVVDHNYGPDGAKSEEVLTMSPVAKSTAYPKDGSDEDNSYARWSPSGSLSLTVANHNLWEQFKVGDKFYLDFTPAE